MRLVRLKVRFTVTLCCNHETVILVVLASVAL